MRLGESDRARLRALCDAATPGPWYAHNTPGCWDEVRADVPDPAHGGAYVVCQPLNTERADAEHNMALIAAARTAVPALLDEVERLEREVADLYQKHLALGIQYGELRERLATEKK